MTAYGYIIVKTLITKVEPDAEVKKSTNEINADQRKREAAQEMEEADKIKIVTAAEAEKDRLHGVGIAQQRKAIVDGLAESIAELDKNTNEMLLKNAQNTVDVSKMTAKMASGSSIQIETLEKTWATITNGIEETRRIQEDARKKRQEDQVRLEAIKQDFNKQYNVPPVRK